MIAVARIEPRKTNLAPERTSLVGRAGDLARLERALQGGARLVTIVGPPGIGKTRLARRHASSARELPGGAYFCDLTETRTAEDVRAAIGAAVGVPLLGDAAAADQIARALAGRGPTHHVHDNIEQIVEHAPSTVGTWLDLCPDVRFVVTSRQRLRLEGEFALELEPLAAADGMRLFEDRALAVRAIRFDSEADRAAMRELVARLDGIPLAIELAAARAAQLGPARLRERLDDRFEVLKSDRRDAAGRQATLRAAIDWSWNLLSPPERSALARTSVFRGGFSLRAAVDVLAAPGETVVVEETIASLCDKCVLALYEPDDLPGETRHRAYESIREYAAERLEAAGEREKTERRHTAHFLRAGEAWATGIDGPDAVSCLRRLGLELDNLVAVHRREADRDPATSVRAALALDRLLRLRGPMELQVELLDRAVALCDALPDLALRARARRARADLRLVRGARDDAWRDLETALEAARAAGDEAACAEVLYSMGRVDRGRGRHDEAVASLERAKEIARRLGLRRVEAVVSTEIAVILAVKRRGAELDGAEALLREALALHEAAGERVAQATARVNLGLVLALRWRMDEARVQAERALQLHRENGSRREEAVARTHVGFLLLNAWPADAGPALEEAHAVAREVGYRLFEGETSWALGMLAVDEGRFDDAERWLLASLELVLPHERANQLAWLGILRHAQGRLGEARAFLDDALGLARARGERFREAIVLAHLGALSAEQGAPDEARARFSEAQRLADELRDPALATAIEALEPSLDLSREAPVPPPSTGVNGRVAVRLLLAARARRESPGRPTVRIGPDGRWFRPPEGPRVDLRRRRALRLVLFALCAKRESEPGVAVSLDDLLAAGWPGEKPTLDSGPKRVHTAVWTLRKLGLGEALVTRDDGYLIDPSVPVIRASR